MRRDLGVGRRPLAASAGLQTSLVNVAILGATLGFSIVLARALQPDGRGHLTAAMLWPNLLAGLGGAGFTEAVVYYSAAARAQSAAIFTHGLLFAAAYSAALCPLGYLAMPWLLAEAHGEATVAAARLFLLTIPLLGLVEFNAAILQGQRRFTAYNALRLIVPAGFLLGTTALALGDALTIRRIIVLHLVLSVFRLAVSLLLIRSRTPLRVEWDGALLGAMLGYAAKAHVGAISQMVNLRLDQLVISKWLAPSQLGLYAIAVNASQLLMALPQAVKLVMVPRIASQVGTERQLVLLRAGFRTYWALSLLMLPLVAVGLFFALPFVYGESFRAAVWPAMVLVTGTLLLGAKDVLSAGLRALGWPWMSSKAELTGVLVTVVLLAALLPLLGIMGAAIASVCAYGVALAFATWGLRVGFGVRPAELLALGLPSPGTVRSLLRGEPRPVRYDS